MTGKQQLLLMVTLLLVCALAINVAVSNLASRAEPMPVPALYSGSTGSTASPEPLGAGYEPVASPSELRRYVEVPLNDEETQLAHQLPFSLRDAASPTPLGVDAQGHLEIDLRIRHLFEFYLSAIGEEPIETLVKRIRLALRALPEPAQTEATAILEGYLHYRNHVAVLKNDMQQSGVIGNAYDLAQVAELKRAVRESRVQFLSDAVAQAFYQREDEYDDYMLARVRIQANDTLSSEQKEQQWQWLDEQAQEWIKNQQREATLVSRTRQQTQVLRDQNASDEDIYALREDVYGAEAADRLQALDSQRAQWQARVTEYHQALSQLKTSYDGVPPESEVRALRETHFNHREMIRIQGIDKAESRL